MTTDFEFRKIAHEVISLQLLLPESDDEQLTRGIQELHIRLRDAAMTATALSNRYEASGADYVRQSTHHLDSALKALNKAGDEDRFNPCVNGEFSRQVVDAGNAIATAFNTCRDLHSLAEAAR